MAVSKKVASKPVRVSRNSSPVRAVAGSGVAQAKKKVAKKK
jgi:hypothetical protein